MQDHIVRAMTKDGFVNAVAISSREITETARRMHKTLPTATAALGRLLAAASMMGNMQKVEDGSITLQIKGGGPLGTLLAVSDAEGNVRGWVENPQISLLEKYRGKLDVGAAVGTDGMLTVIRDLRMKEPYVGSVELVSGEIAEDITQYFAQSEQIPTAIGLGVLVDTDNSVINSGGFMLQLMPEATEEAAAMLEDKIRALPPITKLLSDGMSAEDMLFYITDGFDMLMENKTVVPKYHCPCSVERMERALVSIGKKELSELIAEKGEAELTCQFCDNKYLFTKAELEKLMEKAK